MPLLKKIFALFIILISKITLAAESGVEATTAVEAVIQEASIFTKSLMAFQQGGIWMWVILALQIASIVIIIDRVVALYFKRKDNAFALANQYEGAIRKGDVKKAYDHAVKRIKGSAMYKTIASGTQTAINLGGREEIQLQMDQQLLAEEQSLTKRIGLLAMLANVGTLTGLLGTIVGMIKSFAAVASASAADKAELLSSGIAEAMNTTAYGLIMAIPALIMFTVLSSRANQLMDNLTQGALKIFYWLTYCYEPVEVAFENTQKKKPTINFSSKETFSEDDPLKESSDALGSLDV